MGCTDEKKYLFDDGFVININVILVAAIHTIAVNHFDEKLWFI